MKRIAPSFFLDVALPSIDVYTDFSLVLGWAWSGHLKYAASMSFPIILQFLSTIYNWFRLEKTENKKWSWPILLFQFWPQWRAMSIMNLDIKNDQNVEEKKKELMREITSTEPFLEAWPSIIIMTIIWLSSNNTPRDAYCFDDGSFDWNTRTWSFPHGSIKWCDGELIHNGTTINTTYESPMVDGSAANYSFDSYCLLNSSFDF